MKIFIDYSDLLLICWSLWSSVGLLKKKRDLLRKNGVDFSEEQFLLNSTLELAHKMSGISDSYPERQKKARQGAVEGKTAMFLLPNKMSGRGR